MSGSAPSRTTSLRWRSATRKRPTSRSTTKRRFPPRRRWISTRRRRRPPQNSSTTRALIPEFVREVTANACELRNRSTGSAAAMNAARASLLALMLCWAFAAFADVAVPPLSGRVVDQTGTLSSADIDSLTQTLRALELRKGSQVAVLIVPTTEPEAIEQYSIRVADAWKIGRKKIDDGALLVIAKNDRHLRIEVGYGLEGALTDVTTKRIIDEDITPKFKAGDFAGGVSAGVNRMIRLIDGETLPAPEPPHWQG